MTLARERYAIRVAALPAGSDVIPFTAQTRLSGVTVAGVTIHKGAVDLIFKAHPDTVSSPAAQELRRITDEVARAGGTPLAVVRDGRLLGAIHLKDVVKAGVRERFGELRKWESAPS